MEDRLLTSDELILLAVAIGDVADSGVGVMISSLAVARISGNVDIELGLMDVIEKYLKANVPEYKEYIKMDKAKYN